MDLTQIQTQRQIMSASMQQALTILQLPLNELQEYLAKIAIENPMVDLNLFSDIGFAHEDLFAFSRKPTRNDDVSKDLSPIENVADIPEQETFVHHLKQQLPQIEKYLPSRYLPICAFIIDSLDSRGYLDEPIDLLASALDISIEDALQALYAVQSLSPTGAGARSLEECLLLQLAEGPNFNRCTLAIVQNYLEQLAQRDFSFIAKALRISKREVEEYFQVIRGLNPIPSNGFLAQQNDNPYIIPEAYVEIQGRSFSVEYNRRAAPMLQINDEYQALLQTTTDPATKEYLSPKRAQAKKLQQDLKKRESTMVQLIQRMLLVQKPYLLNEVPAPLPLSVQDLAEALELHPSTISRGIKDKYISISGRTIPLKNLLCTQIGKGIPVSQDMLRVYMTKLLNSEDKLHPLSDESLREALCTMNIFLSRRAVAQYRERFGFPTAAMRRRRSTKQPAAGTTQTEA